MFMRLYLLLLLSLLLIPVVFGQTLPIGLQKAQAYNQQQASLYAVQLTFVIAFLAGILSFLSPCILPIIPAFFAYTFKEKTSITKMTLIFFLGFSLVFTFMGVAAGALGQSFGDWQIRHSWLIYTAGVFLIVFGLLTIFGKGFTSLFQFSRVPGKDVLGVFFFGMAFAIGWSACLGPILTAILLMAAILQNYWTSGLLFFVYSLGIAVPLFLLSFFYDRSKKLQKFLQHKQYRFTFLDSTFYTSFPQILAGALFILMGVVFLIYRGTYLINSFDPLHIKPYFYSLQDVLLQSHSWLIVCLAVFVFVLLLYFLWNGFRKRR